MNVEANNNVNTILTTAQQKRSKNLPLHMKLTNIKAPSDSVAGNKSLNPNLKAAKKKFLTLSTNNIFTELRTFEENPDKMVYSI